MAWDDPSASIQADFPIRASDIRKIQENIGAMGAGDAGAPRIHPLSRDVTAPLVFAARGGIGSSSGDIGEWIIDLPLYTTTDGLINWDHGGPRYGGSPADAGSWPTGGWTPDAPSQVEATYGDIGTYYRGSVNDLTPQMAIEACLLSSVVTAMDADAGTGLATLSWLVKLSVNGAGNYQPSTGGFHQLEITTAADTKLFQVEQASDPGRLSALWARLVWSSGNLLCRFRLRREPSGSHRVHSEVNVYAIGS